MIPTYNSSAFLVATLLAVMAQDPGPEKMQIEIVDDCSAGDPALETLHKLGLAGRVGYYRQPQNMGLAKNWNTCIQRARGELVHILHQDDLVMPGFYAALQKAFLQQPEIGAAYCRHQFICGVNEILGLSAIEQPEPGIFSNLLERLSVKQIIQTPAIAVRRCVYERMGGFHPDLFFVLDWEMWLRIASTFPVWYEPQVLAAYRRHSQSETAHLEKSGKTISDIRKFYRIRRSYLPDVIARRSEEESRQIYSQTVFRRAFDLLGQHKMSEGIHFIIQGLSLKVDYQTIITLFRMTKKLVGKQLREW